MFLRLFARKPAVAAPRSFVAGYATNSKYNRFVPTFGTYPKGFNVGGLHGGLARKESEEHGERRSEVE